LSRLEARGNLYVLKGVYLKDPAVIDSTTVHFDAQMMTRYGQAGPRYTSYPTAPQFKQEITAQDYILAATQSDQALKREPLSVYVHIPFCFSPCFYCGCNRVITRDVTKAERYLHYLEREIVMRGRNFDRRRPVEQLHLGGGTPTFLPKPLLSELMGELAQQFQLIDSPERDYSIEIDPRTVDRGTLELLKDLKFNRVSLGVQDFDPAVQRVVNREQPAKMVEGIYATARELGFQSINFDLIYGLPLQTLDSFRTTLDRVIALRPDRLAVYGYAHMPQLFKAQGKIRSESLPDAGTRMALLQLAIERLCAAGYLYIGLDHFALPSDGLAQAKQRASLHRSFQGYTTHANRDLVSLGVSAIGRVGNVYVQNHKNLKDYEAAIERGALPSQRGMVMDQDDCIRADVIQQIMCHGRIQPQAIESRHGIVFHEYFVRELRQLAVLERDGLIEPRADGLQLTPAGRLLMRAVAMTFDAYLHPAAPAPAMSRVV
jgi:oxygen-independent coproporphyrinogen-3 oxidase